MRKVKNKASRTGWSNMLPSVKVLRTLFRYDKKSGNLYWRIRINSAIKLGVPIGSKQRAKGHRLYVRIYGILYHVSRVIWKWVTGVDPGSKEVDHDDNDKTNNKWSNLNLLSRQQNLDRRDKKRIAENTRRQFKNREMNNNWRKSMGYQLI